MSLGSKLSGSRESESRNGNRYLAGFLGPMGVIAFVDEKAEPREGVICEWQVYFTERDDPYRQPRAAAAEQRPPRKVAPIRRPKIERYRRPESEPRRQSQPAP